jgi:hypothetical protein
VGQKTIEVIIKHPGYKGEHPLKIACPQIIDTDLWELAQRMRKENRKLNRKSKQ